jgi:hypothetical protein
MARPILRVFNTTTSLSYGRCVQASGLLQPLFVVVFAYDGLRLPRFRGLFALALSDTKAGIDEACTL